MGKEAKRFKIITPGCKVNQFESACLRGAFLHAGWREVLKEGCADVNIDNSCIVTQRASYQTRQAIRKVIKESPSATTAVFGCYAQVFPEELSGIEGVSLVVGNTMKSRVPEMLLDSHPPCPPLLNIPPFSKGGNGGISHASSFFDKDTAEELEIQQHTIQALQEIATLNGEWLAVQNDKVRGLELEKEKQLAILEGKKAELVLTMLANEEKLKGFNETDSEGYVNAVRNTVEMLRRRIALIEEEIGVTKELANLQIEMMKEDEWKTALRTYSQGLLDFNKNLADSVVDVASTMKSSMQDFFDVTSDGFMDFRKLAIDALNQILRKITELMIRRITVRARLSITTRIWISWRGRFARRCG